LRAFWGVTVYCRIWILGYADLARPLYKILKERQKDAQTFIEWDDKSENAFHRIKEALMTAPTLGLLVQVSIICLCKRRTGLGSGDSAPGHHSPFSRLLKQRVRSGSQEMDRMS
jgi:hypothetical protein